MRGLNKMYYAILYNMHIACQITSSTIQLYAIYAKKRRKSMKVCYTGGAVKDCGSYYSVATKL